VRLEHPHQLVSDLDSDAILHREAPPNTRTSRVSLEMPMIS